MDKRLIIKLIATAALAVLAGILVVRAIRGHGGGREGMVYFYDLSEKKLFAAPRDSVPPIRGMNDATADGVRAIVITDSADAKDKKKQRIAYLEKYTPGLKKLFEDARGGGEGAQTAGGTIRREDVPANTLVRRLSDSEWHTMNTPEGEKIVTEWNVPGPDGAYPTVCVP
jgi:hypothetical protein